MEWALDEMAAKIAKTHPSPKNLIVLGMATRGIPLGQRLAEKLTQKYDFEIPLGSIDATFYRDDFHYRDRIQNTEMRIKTMPADRKSTRLNSSHVRISYAVFCLKK